MRRIIAMCVIILLISFTNLPVAFAQAGWPEFQIISINGVEPPPPGIYTQMEWAGMGAGPSPKRCLTDAYFMASSAFNPPLSSRDFAIRLYCTEKTGAGTMKFAFYQIDDWFKGPGTPPMGDLIAVREVYSDGKQDIWIHVKVGRSAPFDFSNIVAVLYFPDGSAGNVRNFSWDYSHCMNSMNPNFEVGKTAYVTPGDPNSLRSKPDGKSKKIGSIPGSAQITIIGGPVCSPNGTTFWQVRHGDLEGWTAQGDLDENWISAYPS